MQQKKGLLSRLLPAIHTKGYFGGFYKNVVYDLYINKHVMLTISRLSGRIEK
jgi:hypothetical protein